MAKRNVDIARQVRAIDWLKAEMVAADGQLLRAMVQGDDEQIIDGLADSIITHYLIARRLGIHFARLDARIQMILRSNATKQHELEQWFGDLSALAAYLHNKEE